MVVAGGDSNVQQIAVGFHPTPDEYMALNTETTDLPDENGLPDIVTFGATVERN